MAGRAVLKAAQAEVNESSRRRDDILEDDLSASHDRLVTRPECGATAGFQGGFNTPHQMMHMCEVDYLVILGILVVMLLGGFECCYLGLGLWL